MWAENEHDVQPIEIRGKGGVYVDDEYVGEFRVNGRTATIRNLYIDESERGKGKGAAVVRQIESLLRARGVRRVYLEDVRDDARGFWERQGYEVEDDGYLQAQDDWNGEEVWSKSLA